jgi:hypothetical protein
MYALNLNEHCALHGLFCVDLNRPQAGTQKFDQNAPKGSGQRKNFSFALLCKIYNLYIWVQCVDFSQNIINKTSLSQIMISFFNLLMTQV